MRRTARPALPVLGLMLVIAVLVLGTSVVAALTAPQLAANGASASSSPSRPAPIPLTDLDLGQVSSADQVATCLSPGFATATSEVDVLYGVRQRQLGGAAGVFVLRNHAGDLRLCDASGADRPSQSPLPTLSDSRPVAFLSNGRSSWQCGSPSAGTSRALSTFQMTTWLLVAPSVQSVQQRYWVDGVAGPWFTTRAQSGFAHLQTWLAGPLPAGTSYAVQYRVLDVSGDVVPQHALPTGRQHLPGCAGGSAQIG